MSRVRYLTVLGGTAERRTAAPLLRPPRRLFPHEPPPLEPLPLLSQPLEATAPPTPEQQGGRPESPAPEPLEPEPAEAVRRSRAWHPEAPLAPSGAEPHVEEVLRPPSEESARPQGEAERVLEAPTASDTRTVAREADATPAPTRRRVPPKPERVELEPARAEPARRSPATPEPSRLRPPAAAPPEHPVAATRPTAAAAQAPGLHIGSIDVVVSPPAPAIREPAFAEPPAPAPRQPTPFAARDASTSRWFGLAQR
jgi:hypothetical protein